MYVRYPDRHEAATRGARQVQGSYKGYKVGARLLQGVQGRYETATSCARGYEAVTMGVRLV